MQISSMFPSEPWKRIRVRSCRIASGHSNKPLKVHTLFAVWQWDGKMSHAPQLIPHIPLNLTVLKWSRHVTFFCLVISCQKTLRKKKKAREKRGEAWDVCKTEFPTKWREGRKMRWLWTSISCWTHMVYTLVTRSKSSRDFPSNRFCLVCLCTTD